MSIFLPFLAAVFEAWVVLTDLGVLLDVAAVFTDACTGGAEVTATF